MSGTAFISIRYEINNPQVFQLPLLSGTMIHIPHDAIAFGLSIVNYSAIIPLD